MNTPSVTLFGYQREKAQIQSCVENIGVTNFICLHGQGGIGKTTMLRAVQEKYTGEAGFCVTDLLDFDDLGLHIVLNVLERIVGYLSCADVPFREYSSKMEQLRHMQLSATPTRLLVQDLEERLVDDFYNSYQAASAGQHIVLLFDTVEKVQDFPFFQELLSLLRKLPNSTLIFSGRRGPEVIELLRKVGVLSDRIFLVELGGLGASDALEYFQRTELGKYLVRENYAQAEAICRLSAGRPILIDLAVDWLGQGLGLPKLPGPPDSLDEQATKDIRKQFERGLVQQVNDLGEPRNELILEMAHVFHYFDTGRLRYLHPDTLEEEAALLFGELRYFSFVKQQPGGGLRLHDEMGRMINEYVWPALDVSGDRRRWLSKHMVAYYQQQLGEYKDDEVRWQALRAEQLYHQLYADVRQGLQAFEPDFRKALGQQTLGYAEVLLNTVNLFSSGFDEELKAWFAVHKGRLLRAEENVESAIELIRPARDKLKSLGVQRDMDMVCNVLGYCYRLLGDWDKAIEAYEESLAYSRQEGNTEQIAETMNNIANVCRLSGDFERASRYSLVSLCVRERLYKRKPSENARSLGNSCYVRGMLSWETGNTAESASYLSRARQLFKQSDYTEGLAQVDRYDAFIHFRTGDLDGALELLQKAMNVFEEKGIGVERADCLNLQARIGISKLAAEEETSDGFSKIQKIVEQALNLAERVGDNFKIAECHLTMCRLLYRWGRLLLQQGHQMEADRYFMRALSEYRDPAGGEMARQRNYLDLLSVYEWTVADLYYTCRDWQNAFAHYLKECAISSRLKGERLFRALNGLSWRLHNLPADTDGVRELTRQYCDYMIDNWKDLGLGNDFPSVIEECEDIKTFFGLVDPRQLERLRNRGADLMHRGEWLRAADVYQQLLMATRTYQPSEQIAEAMAQSAWAYRQIGEFARARRLCMQSMLIRDALGAPAHLADSHLVMGSIMWITGNVVEASRHFRLARNLYTEADDPIGNAKVDRQLAFLYFVINDYQEAYKYIERAIGVFRAKNLFAELADALTLYQRISVRLPDEPDSPDRSRQAIQESRELAEQYGFHYVMVETWIAEVVAENRLYQQTGDKSDLQRAKDAFQRGYQLAEQYDYWLLMSVFQALAGRIEFGERHFADAFEHFANDLELGSRYSRSRLLRELDSIGSHLVQLDEPLRSYYADYIINTWQDRGLAEQAPDVPRLFQLLKEYSLYV